MEKVTTLTMTLHDSLNCGSSLQAYALQEFLLEQGIDNKIIDYLPRYIKNEGHCIKNIIKRIIKRKDYSKKLKNFNIFKSNYLDCTEQKFYSKRALKRAGLKADYFITGSDQLWNKNYKCGNDSAFYLDFINKGKKVAYGISLGEESIAETVWLKEKDNLNKFELLAFRERASTDFFCRKSYTNCKFVCDPVLLLNFEHWTGFLRENIYGDYILVYLVMKSDLLEKLITFLRNTYRCKVIAIGSFRKHSNADLYIYDDNPIDFLNLIYHSKMIVAGSFHAMLFSLIFHKNMALILPGRNATRIIDCMDFFSVSDRIIKSEKNFNNLLKKIDYSEIDKKMEAFAHESKKILMDALGQAYRTKQDQLREIDTMKGRK